ncbi:MAG: hypothetical protein PHU85_19535 [Phycisphaerae bacterium]|nr:hypothetical protein [Phycisphaerae bacterium]
MTARLRTIPWLLLMVAVATAVAYPRTMILPRSADTSIFVWIGQRMQQGELPYRDYWDNKLPPLYWLNHLAAATGKPEAAVWAMFAIALAAGGWMMFGLGRRMFDPVAAGLTGLTYVSLAGSQVMAETVNLTEVWAAPFAILTIYAMVRAVDAPRRAGLWILLSGFGLGAASCFRPPIALIGAALIPLLPAIYRAGRLTVVSAATWLAGLALMPAVIAAWAIANGVFGPMWQNCIMFNFAYGAGAARPAWATWAHARTEIANLIRDTQVWHVLGAAGLLVLLIPWRVEKPDPTTRLRPINLRLIAIVWMAMGAASALPGLRLYPHHCYPALAGVAMLSLWAWGALVALERAARWLAIVAVVAVLVGTSWLAGQHLRGSWAQAAARRHQMRFTLQAADYLRTRSDGRESIFVFGWGIQSEIMPRLGWRCSTRHPMVLFYPELHIGKQLVAEWREDMLTHPPDWLVCTGGEDLVKSQPWITDEWDQPYAWGALKDVHEFCRDRYVLDSKFLECKGKGGACGTGVVIYRRKDLATRPDSH